MAATAQPGSRRPSRLVTTLAALFVLTAPTPAPAAAQAVPADNPEARAGDLRIVQLWTTEGERLKASLQRGERPDLAYSTTAMRNQPIQQVILYADCQRDPDDHCWLTAKIGITAPDGTPYGEPLAFDALPIGSAAARGAVGLAPNSITLVIEHGEQLGRYRVELAVTDEIAVQTAVSVVHLHIVEANAAQR